MHCHQHVVVHYYALWSALINGSQDALSPHKQVDASQPTVNLYLRGLDNVVSSDGWPQDVNGCAISLNWPFKWGKPADISHSREKNRTNYQATKPETGLNLMLTLTNFDWRTGDLQDCKDNFDNLLFSGQHETPECLDLTLYLSLPKQTGEETSRNGPKADQRHIQRRKLISTSNDHHKKLCSTNLTLSCSTLFDYVLLSISQHRSVYGPVDTAKNEEPRSRQTLKRAQTPALPVYSAMRRQQATPSVPANDRSACEQTFCKGYNLKKICGQHKKPNAELDAESVCEMCYPRENATLIKKHCEERQRREIQAFHIICITLGVTIAVAAVMYLIRAACRPLRKRCQVLRRIRTGQIPTSPATVSRFSSIFSMDSSLGFTPAHIFDSEMDSAESERDAKRSTTAFSVFQQRVNRLLAKEPRKRIQDVFDLESLPQTHPKEKGFPERAPALLQVPNERIRKSSTDGHPIHVSKGDRESSSRDSIDKLVTSHGTRDTADMPPQYAP